MAFKKLIVNELGQCPDCGGKSGLRYYVKMDVPHLIKWGDNVRTIAKEFLSVNAKKKRKETKTARCIDCGKRVEFEINEHIKDCACYACGKPRKKKGNVFITPCPHCGDEVPF